MGVENSSNFGKCQVQDSRYVYPRDEHPYYKQYKKPCNFPAEGFISGNAKEYIPACSYHLLLFTEDLEYYKEE